MSADNSVSTNGNTEDNTEEGVILDYRNALVAIMQLHYKNSKEFMFINGNDYWHKITVSIVINLVNMCIRNYYF